MDHNSLNLGPGFRHDVYWSSFMTCLLLPFLIAPFSPLIYGASIPLIGAAFILLYRPFLGSWPGFGTRAGLVLPVLLLLLTALLFISSFWSIDRQASLDLAAKLTLLFTGGVSLILLARNCPKPIWEKYYLLFPCAILLTGLAAAFEIFFEFPFHRKIYALNSYEVSPSVMNRQIAVFTLTFPVSLYLVWKSRSVLFALALFLTAIFLFPLAPAPVLQASMIVVLALSIGCLFFIEKLTIRGFFLLAGFISLMMPWLTPTAFDLFGDKIASLKLENWDFISRRIMERPLTGFGLDATRAMSYDTDNIYSTNLRVNHPHNAALQLWIELGLLGSLVSLLVFFGFYYTLVKSSRAQRRLGFIAFAAALTLLMASWQLWSSWLIGFFFALAALIILATKTNSGPANS